MPSLWKIEEGAYTSVPDLIHEVNKAYGNRPLLEFRPHTRRVKLDQNVVNSETDMMVLQGNMASQLGFRPSENILKYKESPEPASVLFGVPHQMMVYCDIIEPQFIGHEVAQVLRNVIIGNASYKFGAPRHVEFENIHYVSVSRKEFHTITINIRDYTGEHLPFSHGVLSLKLHIKEVPSKE